MSLLTKPRLSLKLLAPSLHRRLLASALLLAAAARPRAVAQALVLPDAPVSAGTLPEAPSDAAAATDPPPGTMVGPHAKFIFPGETVPRLTARNKVVMGLIHGVSLDSVTVWIVTSGYSHIQNSAPHYGTDSAAYGQRLGASALRAYTEETLGNSVLAPLLHQDPRYYKMGGRRGVGTRALYAVSRVFVVRNDDGRLVPNLWQAGGNLAGAALTNAYYPSADRTAGQTLVTFGNSMGGAAVSNLAAEFFPNQLVARALGHVHMMPGK